MYFLLHYNYQIPLVVSYFADYMQASEPKLKHLFYQQSGKKDTDLTDDHKNAEYQIP